MLDPSSAPSVSFRCTQFAAAEFALLLVLEPQQIGMVVILLRVAARSNELPRTVLSSCLS
jgi:hypothetical protein